MSLVSPARHRVARRILLLAVAVVGLIAVPATAHAATSTFHRFEANAVAIFRNVTVPCEDGTTARLGFRVTGGHEEESEDGVGTEDSDFLTVFVSGVDCGGVFINDTGTGDATFTWSPSLQTAGVSGTITTRDGRSITVDLTWEATGPMEVDTNTTTFPGFTGHFVGQRRDAVATGTITLDGRLVVNGSTTDAQIETLEDTNISTPA
ncbi:MAG TPA: hypothetical protein VE547_21305 [Mycobacteriales bacterium]|jgi:hypothetical protein|nr:hypothetical protein [Mycobacteriales bacterium]